MNRFIIAGTVVIVCFFVCCSHASQKSSDDAKATLGRYLFYDRRLSVNQAKSCAGCHAPQFAFTDGYRRSFGATADLHQRNTQPLFNLDLMERYTSADPSITTLEQQMRNPLFNAKFIEMGMMGHEHEMLKRLKADNMYRQLFAKAFPGKKDTVEINDVIDAITVFMKTLNSFDSPYDHYRNGDRAALDASAQRGMQLFFSDSLKCADCHSGVNFSGGLKDSMLAVNDRLYFNNGLYNTDGKGAYPADDEGLKSFTHNAADMGKFRVPTLRNLAFTGPYMHDGSMSSLPEIIDMYARGGRLIEKGEHHGDGRSNPYKDQRIKGFAITPQQKADLVNFLLSLSDKNFIENPAYQNPFTGDETKGY